MRSDESLPAELQKNEEVTDVTYQTGLLVLSPERPVRIDGHVIQWIDLHQTLCACAPKDICHVECVRLHVHG